MDRGHQYRGKEPRYDDFPRHQNNHGRYGPEPVSRGPPVPPLDYTIGPTHNTRREQPLNTTSRWDNPSYEPEPRERPIPPLDYSVAPKWYHTPVSDGPGRADSNRPLPGRYRPPQQKNSFSSHGCSSVASKTYFSDYRDVDNVPKDPHPYEAPRGVEEKYHYLYGGKENGFGMEPENAFKFQNGGYKKKQKDGDSLDSDRSYGSNTGQKLAFISLRCFTILLLLWDLANDWIVASVGPSPFITEATDKARQMACVGNKDLFVDLKLNVSKVDTSYCNDPTTIYTVLAVFVIIASMITILQVINILLEFMGSGKKTLSLMDGQSEICLAIYVEEIPQAITLALFFFSCECTSEKLEVGLFNLLASISAISSLTFRFATSFPSISGDNGCCNQWWRCCCCRNSEYCCHVKPREFFCTCNIPFPMFCCTLRCNNCKCHPVTWCSAVLKVFSCFCNCCKDDDVHYGIRLVNILGLLVLWAAFALQIVIYVL